MAAAAHPEKGYPDGSGLPGFAFLERLRHVDALERQEPLVAAVELLVMAEDERDQLLAVDEPEVALGAGEGLSLAGERPKAVRQPIGASLLKVLRRCPPCRFSTPPSWPRSAIHPET